jgi:hypothetical protein
MPQTIKTIKEREDAVSGQARGIKIIFYSKSGCILCDQLLPRIRENYHADSVHVFKVDAIGADEVDFTLKKFPTLHIYKDGLKLSELVQPSIEGLKKQLTDIIAEEF